MKSVEIGTASLEVDRRLLGATILLAFHLRRAGPRSAKRTKAHLPTSEQLGSQGQVRPQVLV